MEFNNFNPIKFTYEFSKASINFVDLNAKLSNGKLQTCLYAKPTDRYQYLLIKSNQTYKKVNSI